MDNTRENSSDVFNYTYSAKQQDEVKRIRDKYAPRTADKMEQLRLLDKSVTRCSTVVSLTVGILSTLVMGTGMSLVLEWENHFAIGILIGLVGIAGIMAAYPLYVAVTKRQRKKIAPQILKLTDELL